MKLTAKQFGEWFPHLEALFTHTILGESEKWRLKYGTILEDDSTTFTCKHPEPEEMGWKAMIGLKSFGVEILCDTKAAREFVCTYENVHTAFLWALVKGSADSLRRLELNNRGFEGKGIEPCSPFAVSPADIS